MSTAARAGHEPNLQIDDAIKPHRQRLLQSQEVCGGSRQAGGEKMFGREELKEAKQERRRLIGQDGPSGCSQTRSWFVSVFVKFHELSLVFWSNN